MSKMMERTLANEAETLQLAEHLAQCCVAPLIIYLRGDLGAGKTCLIRGFCQASGVVDKIKSPSYAIVESYSLSDFDIHHFDLYRIHDPEELEYLAYREYFQANAIVCIEWPERGDPLLPTADLEISLQPIQQGRTVSLLANSPSGEAVLTKLLKEYHV